MRLIVAKSPRPLKSQAAVVIAWIRTLENPRCPSSLLGVLFQITVPDC